MKTVRKEIRGLEELRKGIRAKHQTPRLTENAVIGQSGLPAGRTPQLRVCGEKQSLTWDSDNSKDGKGRRGLGWLQYLCSLSFDYQPSSF